MHKCVIHCIICDAVVVEGLLNGDAGAAPPRWYGALPFSSSTIESKLAMLQRHAKMLWLRLGFPSDDALPNDSTAKTAIIFVGKTTAFLPVFGCCVSCCIIVCAIECPPT